MSELPTFSVVVPTRGRPDELGRCLASLAELDYPREHYEVVVAVDGIDDPASAEVVRGHADRVDLQLVVEPRAGPGAARNAGAARAAGRFLAFTDDDCRADPRWLRALATVLATHPTAAVGGRTVNGAPANGYSAASQTVLEAVYAHYNRPGRAPHFFATNNLAFPADAFRDVGGFDAGFPFAEDRELCARWAALGGHMASAPAAIVHHMRELDLRGFVRQHIGYGRGARHFHRSMRPARRLMPALEPGFYRCLAAECRPQGPGLGRVRMAALLATSQLANALGFALDRSDSHRAGRASPASMVPFSRPANPRPRPRPRVGAGARARWPSRRSWR